MNHTAHAGHNHGGFDLPTAAGCGVDYKCDIGYPAAPGNWWRFAYLFVFNYVIGFPVLMWAPWKIALPLVFVGIYDVFWHQHPDMGIGINFYAHYALGILCLKLGGRCLRSADGLLRVSPKVMLFIVPALIAFVGRTMLYTNIRRLHEQVHCFVYFILLLLGCSMSASTIVDSRYPELSEVVLAIRRLFDPGLQFALGVLTFSHKHDMRPVGLFWHQFQGLLLMSKAVVHFLSIQAHEQHGFYSASARMYRMLYAFQWNLQAMTLFTMSVVIYAFNHGGLHHMVYALQEPPPFEEMCSYVAMDTLLALFWVAGKLVTHARTGTFDAMDDLYVVQPKSAPLFGSRSHVVVHDDAEEEELPNGNGHSKRNGISAEAMAGGGSLGGATIGSPFDDTPMGNGGDFIVKKV
eukprot:TRINITY_DN14701_c0_g2_i1.p1 TRINITY_DN14701_c0_g2~~TRINITY_DN14701_c0_g2_i1.p1  ORF type:complete len:406 (+),score=56.61 TRINITY_DN14701_c0_g2_i1:173-1390(+)